MNTTACQIPEHGTDCRVDVQTQRHVSGPDLPKPKQDDDGAPGAIFLVIGVLILAAILFASWMVIREDQERIEASPSPPPLSLPTSQGITQEQLDELGASIGARYATGDTEVAQALLSSFMDAHPECVSAVMAGGEGKMRDVLAESEKVAEYLESTGPHPNTYTTVITVKQDDGSVKAAVLGVSCR